MISAQQAGLNTSGAFLSRGGNLTPAGQTPVAAVGSPAYRIRRRKDHPSLPDYTYRPDRRYTPLRENDGDSGSHAGMIPARSLGGIPLLRRHSLDCTPVFEPRRRLQLRCGTDTIESDNSLQEKPVMGSGHAVSVESVWPDIARVVVSRQDIARRVGNLPDICVLTPHAARDGAP